MALNTSELRYVACWTEHGGVQCCGCRHDSIAAAMGCFTPDGRTFIRAWENGVLRSLTDDELKIFTLELGARILKDRPEKTKNL